MFTANFPVFIKLNNQPCLVIGGGEVALRKIRMLLKAKANITVVAPELCDELSEMKKADKIIHAQTVFSD